MAVPFHIPTCSLKEHIAYNSIYAIFSRRQSLMRENKSGGQDARWEKVWLQRDSTVLRGDKPLLYPLSSPTSHFVRTHLWHFFFHKNLPCHHETGSGCLPGLWRLPHWSAYTCPHQQCPGQEEMGWSTGSALLAAAAVEIVRSWTTAVMGAARSTRLERLKQHRECLCVYTTFILKATV